MLYQPSRRTVIQIDLKYRIAHPGSPYYQGMTLYEDHSIFTSFAIDDAKPYGMYPSRQVFSDSRGYWSYFTDTEIKRMRIEEAHE